MINKQRFGENISLSFCKEPEMIENYDRAISDTEETWHCHHRLETHNSDGEKRLIDIKMEELIALDMYYNRPPEELIFLTNYEHKSLHSKGKANTLGKKYSLETRRKMSESMKKHTVSRSVIEAAAKAREKKVTCIETNETFNSVKEACIWCKSSHVSKACLGKIKTAGGYHWKFA